MTRQNIVQQITIEVVLWLLSNKKVFQRNKESSNVHGSESMK